MTCEGIDLPKGMTIKEVESEGQRYLGILELDKVKDKEMKGDFQKIYETTQGSVEIKAKWEE